MKEAVIVSAARTAIGTFSGTLANTSASELGAVVIRAALERAKVEPCAVDEVLMGCILQSRRPAPPSTRYADPG